MPRDIQDHYFRQAKRDGYRSRAAYKLIEIDDRKKIFNEGDHVLDCGCAPGSWLQVASKLVGAEGVVVGIDLKPVEGNFRESNIHVIQGDFRETPRQDLLAPLHEIKGTVPFYQVVLSDMAPGTTGEQTMDHHRSVRLCKALLERLGELLGKGGNGVIKVFEGETYPELLAQIRGVFNKAKGFKPKASRSESREMYIIAHGYKGAGEDASPGDAADEDSEQTIELPKRKPSKGWG